MRDYVWGGEGHRRLVSCRFNDGKKWTPPPIKTTTKLKQGNEPDLVRRDFKETNNLQEVKQSMIYAI